MAQHGFGLISAQLAVLDRDREILMQRARFTNLLFHLRFKALIDPRLSPWRGTGRAGVGKERPASAPLWGNDRDPWCNRRARSTGPRSSNSCASLLRSVPPVPFRRPVCLPSNDSPNSSPLIRATDGRATTSVSDAPPRSSSCSRDRMAEHIVIFPSARRDRPTARQLLIGAAQASIICVERLQELRCGFASPQAVG